MMIKNEGKLKGKDVHHKDRNPRNNKRSNLRIQSKKKNRETTSKPMEVPDKLKDFRNFLYIVWKELNLPDPTTIQYEIADYMQKEIDELLSKALGSR